MRNSWLECFGVVALLLGALPFVNLLAELPLIALASVAFVALTAAGYEITRRNSNKQ